MEVNVWRFDRLPDGGAEMEADWFLRNESGERLFEAQDLVIREPATAAGADGTPRIEDTVRAMSRVVGRLADSIAATIANTNLGQ